MPQVIKGKLANDRDSIIDILDQYGFCKFKNRGIYIKFAFDEESAGSCEINTENLSYVRFSNGSKGDIINAIQEKTAMSFFNVLKSLRSKLGISEEDCIDNINTRKGFCDFFKDINKYKHQNIYLKNDYEVFERIISRTLLYEGISATTQDIFDVRYDHETDRIVFLWRDISGKVVGANCRANWNIDKDYKWKYLCLLNFNKGDYLYGEFENGEYIKETKFLYLFEAEKSVMQCYEQNNKNALALGSNNITEKQLAKIKAFGITTVILCFDQNTEYAYILKRGLALKELGCKVFAVYDKDKRYLKEKESPSDYGEETFMKLVEECLIEI